MKLDQADIWFSRYVRLLQGKCQRCGSPVKFNDQGDPISHHLSHFQGRRKEASRYDLSNVDTMCSGCHRHLTAFPYEHVKWQIDTKGQQKVDEIILKSNQFKKKDRATEAKLWKTRYLELKKVLPK